MTDAKDIIDVTARDFTGDGKAEIIVRAVLHAKASKALGGDMVERRALMIYGIKDDALARVFAAETSRAVGDNEVLGAVAFEPGKRGLEIELRARARTGLDREELSLPRRTAPPRAAWSRCFCRGATPASAAITGTAARTSWNSARATNLSLGKESGSDRAFRFALKSSKIHEQCRCPTALSDRSLLSDNFVGYLLPR